MIHGDPSLISETHLNFTTPNLGHTGVTGKILGNPTGNNQETAGEPRGDRCFYELHQLSLPKVEASVSRCYVCFRVLYVSELIHHQFHPFSGAMLLGSIFRWFFLFFFWLLVGASHKGRGGSGSDPWNFCSKKPTLQVATSEGCLFLGINRQHGPQLGSMENGG